MTVVKSLTHFVGTWKGINRLRMMPMDDFQESASSATVSVTAQTFVTIAYAWSDAGTPQDGLLLVSDTGAVWVDSFHTAGSWMTFSGGIDPDGVVRLNGSYPAPEGPDWGWQIHLEAGETDGGRMTMYNIPPGIDPYPVVEAVYPA